MTHRLLPDRLGSLALLAAWALVAFPLGAAAQTQSQATPTTAPASLLEATSTPEAAAELFVRSVRSIRWGTAAQFLHAETLDRFRVVVTMIADADSTGSVRRYLADVDSAQFAALDAEVVFERSIGAMIDDMPGLMHALYDRDDRVLGHVLESPDSAHVVYRTTARISGAVSEVKVMQLTNTPDGWRVRWSDELEVLDAAVRGVARRRTPPPPPPAPR